MSTSWLRWTFAAAMIGVALFHVVRLAASRAGHRPGSVDAELTHAAMGVVMTVMLLGVLAPSESRQLALVFAAPLIWFVCRGVHSYIIDGPRAVGASVRHVVGCAAMIYMLLAVTGASAGASAVASSMPGMSMATTSLSSPIAVGTLLAATLGVALWTVARPRTVGLPAAPALAAGCQLAMNAATVYMLVAM